MGKQQRSEPGKFYYLSQLFWLRRLLWKRRWRSKSSSIQIMGSLGIVLGCLLGVIGFIAAFQIGVSLFPELEAHTVAMVFGAVVLVYVSMRFFTVLISMQSAEGYPLDNLLHLPLLVRQVFYLNFAIAQITFSTVFFVPILLGLAIGATLSLALINLLLIVFVFVVVLFSSAIVYQFQSWMLTKVSNPRHRMVVVAILMGIFVLLFQVPNVYFQYTRLQEDTPESVVLASPDDVNSAGTESSAGIGDSYEYLGPQADLRTGWVINESTSERIPWKLVLAIFILTLLSAASLRRSYNQTLRKYQLGQSGSNQGEARDSVETSAKQRKSFPVNLGAAVAYASLRIYWRSSLGKIALFMPLQFLLIGGIFWFSLPTLYEPDSLPYVLIGFISLCGLPMNVAFNLFALDGRGFALYLQSGIDMKQVLLGKLFVNIPLFTMVAGLLLGFTVFLTELSNSYILAMLFQFCSVFLVLNSIALTFSIRFPVAVSPSSAKVKGYGAIGFACLISEIGAVALIMLTVNLLMGMDSSPEAVLGTFSYFLIGSALEFVILLGCFLPLFQVLSKHLKNRVFTVHDAVTTIPQ